jgi:hypothetical protein
MGAKQTERDRSGLAGGVEARTRGEPGEGAG